MVKLDEVFDVTGFDNDHFISVNLPDDDFFPRLVVGNFHRDIGFVEATHSFYWSRLGDDVLQPQEADLLSFIPAPNVPELNLEMVFFPTNAPSMVTATLREQRAGGRLARDRRAEDLGDRRTRRRALALSGEARGRADLVRFPQSGTAGAPEHLLPLFGARQQSARSAPTLRPARTRMSIRQSIRTGDTG